MPLTPLLSDSFNRDDGDLDGSTLDNAGGGSGTHTWDALSGTWDILTNRARCASGGDNVCIVSTMANTADMRVSAVSRGDGASLTARVTDATDGYIAFRFATGVVACYEANGTPLGGTAPGAIADGDTLALECIGDQITVKVNGSTVLGPFTNSTYTTGKAGLRNPNTLAGISDDFLVETEGAVDPPDATYAAFSGGCEAAGGPITPTNTGGAITSAAIAAGSPDSAMPTGFALGANGVVTITHANMVVGDIRAWSFLLDLTNAAGTQEDVPLSITITANPPVNSWGTNALVASCKATPVDQPVTTTHDSGPAVVAGTYVLVGSKTDVSVDAADGEVHLIPDRAQWCAPTALAIEYESAGGQTGSTPITVEFDFSGQVTLNDGGTWDVQLRFGGGSDGGAGSVIIPSRIKTGGRVKQGRFKSSRFARASEGIKG